MPFVGEWCRVWIYFGFVFAWAKGARPRFDISTDMGLVLVPADAEVDSVIFRLRATDQDVDFPLVFEITATITPVVRIDNLPCSLYNKVCQANVILTKRLVPGRLHDFAVRVRDTKGDSNSMQATISVTNATTPRDKIFPHIPSLIMVPEDTKVDTELDYVLVRANPWSGIPVYIELWQPKELFTIRQKQTRLQTRGVITLKGELDFETQSMYTLTMYAMDPYTEPGKDTRNIAGLSVVVVVQDVQDVPPIFTLAPPLTRINNSVQPGDIILRVHAEDGDKGVPREIVYGLVSESNPFTPFFNISETSGEIILARPLEELTQITHVGAPVVLTVVAEEIRRSRDEPPAQATVVDVGLLLGEPGNSPPYFESDNYMATIDENLEPGTVINFGEHYSTRVKDEDIGKAGVFALKLENNNNTFEINPTVAERTADFVISVRDNTLINYELYKSLSFKIVAQEVGPATNLSASVPVTIFLRDVNDNPPVFEEESYEVTLPENVTAGSRVVQVHATDKDTGDFGRIRYTSITGEGSEAFTMDPDTGLITVSMGSSLDREVTARLVLGVEARDENGNGNRGAVPLIINLLDVNDNAPIFENDVYEFMLNSDLSNFTSPAFIKAIDADVEPPNNVVRYEIVHGNYENKFYLNETSGELILRSPITKIRRKKQSAHDKLSKENEKKLVRNNDKVLLGSSVRVSGDELSINNQNKSNQNLSRGVIMKIRKRRQKRANEDALYTLTARAYDLGVPHLSSVTQIRILSGIPMEARIMMFVVPGEQPNLTKTAETLAAITGGRVTVLETRPYNQQNPIGTSNTLPGGGKKSIVIARVEQTEPGTPLVDVEKIREVLAANGVGIINGTDPLMNATMNIDHIKPAIDVQSGGSTNNIQTSIINNNITSVQSEEVTVYKAENKLLLWLLIILGILMLLAIAILIICCIHPGCPFYMAPRKRRVHSSETLLVRSDGRPKRHLHRQPAIPAELSWNGRKQAWSADPTRRNWQFNKRNVKNCSLPGDVAYPSGQPNDVQMNVEAPRLTEGPGYDHSRRSRMDDQDRLYMEDVDGQKARAFDTAEFDSLQRHEMDRGSDMQRHSYRQRYIEPNMNEETTMREQHFYREGNAEVLRLVTRGQVEDTSSHLHHPHHHRSTTLIVDGKDIILQRFIEDQKSRHELSVQDIEAARSMESHQRSKEIYQQQPPEIILIPDKLDLGHRQHVEEIGPNVQRLVIDHGDYELQAMEKEAPIRDTVKQERQEAAGTPLSERPPAANKDHIQPNKTQYSLHDLELARQNALLTRLLLERESKRPGGGGVDSTSYLETQSLPGQVAIATQTDRTAATQTDRHVRSRSDNDESDEESRHRKKLKSRKRYGDGEWRRSRTLWMKSPIEEEGSPCFDKRLSILRKKVKEVKEGKKILEPEVLREISDSLDGNGSSYRAEEDESTRTYRKSTEQTSISYKILNEKKEDSQSSEERERKQQKSCEDVTDDQKMNVTESTSSPEIKIQREKPDDKSPRKEGKSKSQKISDSMIKPSFRILEKEFTMLTKKLSKLGDKRFQESTGSDSTSQEKSEPSAKESKKEPVHKSLKKSDGGQKQAAETAPSKTEQKMKQKKEAAIARTKQKLKYQQAHVMSTGSSEYDDALDKPKKLRQETNKQKHPVGTQAHAKLKRQPQTDRRELKKQTTELRDEEAEKRKHSPSRGVLKDEKRTRAPKLAAISHKGSISEETSTSTESKKDAFNFLNFKKKSRSISSDKDSNRTLKEEEKTIAKKETQRFSDNFVDEFEATTKTRIKEEVKCVKKEIGPSKDEYGGNSKIQDAKISHEKSEDPEPLASIKEVGASFISHVADIKQQLTKDHAATDIVQIKEETMIEAKDNAVDKETEKQSTLTEIQSPVEELKQDKQLVDTENITKLNESTMKTVKEEHENKMVSEFIKDAEEVAPVKLDSFKEEDKSLRDTKTHADEAEKVITEEQEETKQSDDAHEYLKQRVEKLFEDQEKQKILLGKVADVVHEQMPEKQSEMNVHTTGTNVDVEGHRHVEETINVEQKEEDMLKIGTAEAQHDGEADLIQKTEKAVEPCATIESPKKKEDDMLKSTEHEKEDKSSEIDKEKEHTDANVEPVVKEEKEIMKIISNEDEEKILDTTDTAHKEISVAIETDDQTSDKNIFLDKAETEDVTEIKKDMTAEDVTKIKKDTTADVTEIKKDTTAEDVTEIKKDTTAEDVTEIKKDIATESISSVEDKCIDKKEEADTIESKTTDHKIFEKEIDSFDEKQKLFLEIATDIMKKEEVSFSEKKETVDKESEAPTKTETGDHQTEERVNVPLSEEKKTVDITVDKQSNEKESTFLNKETAPDKEETLTELATVADRNISEKESVFLDKESRKHPDKGKEVITTSTIKDHQITEQGTVSSDEIKEKHHDQQEEPIKDFQIAEKDIEFLDEIKKEHHDETTDDSPTSKETVDVTESIQIEEPDSIAEKKDDTSEMKFQKVDERINGQEKNGTSKTPTVDKQDSHEDVPSNVPVSSPEKEKEAVTEAPPKDDQSIDKNGVVAEMVKGVNSIVDTLTAKEESIATSSELETESVKPLSDQNDTILKEVVLPLLPLLHFDYKKEDDVEAPKSDKIADPKIDSESLKHPEENSNIEEAGEEINQNKSMVLADDRTKITPMDAVEEDSTIDATEKSKKEEFTDSKETDKSVEKLVDETPEEKKESTESSTDKLSPIKIINETMNDQQDTSKEPVPTLEDRMVPKMAAENGTIDHKLVQNSEKKEELQEQPASFQETSSPASEVASEEKFTLDSITSETPTDSKKAVELEEQLKLDNEQTEVQKARTAVEQISAANEDETRPFPGQRSHMERDVTAVSQDQGKKEDAYKTFLPETERKEDGELYADVSLPLFTSIIDTMDDSDDSDSSSDISRKTTLTTRPYQTPRHRARQSPEKETGQTEETEVHDIEDEEKTLMGLVENKEIKMSEETEDTDEEQPSLVIEEIVAPNEANGTSKVTETPFAHEKMIGNIPKENVQQKQSGLKSASTFDKDHSKHTKDAKLKPQESSSTHKYGKTEYLKPDDRRTKDAERKKAPLRGKKKSSSEESSEERAAYFQDPSSHGRLGFHKKPSDRQTQKDGNQAKSRKMDEEQRRRQYVSKLKPEKEKHSTLPKTSEIDTSKAQPKYMAWYKKNREEMEKKRAELMATDEEDQLPRWLRRSMKNQKLDKDKKTPGQKAAETTPRMKRKVKPLVNVESEQLKAIVRQGRKLRRAEGGKNEDPPVQIFATTPPAAPQTTSKHHLVQHSEYKYEKVPPPFYLHPPPAPHPSPQLSPQHFEISPTMEPAHTEAEYDSGIAISLQGGTRLRHQQLLEKKSVFDIAYSEAAPSQLRSDSTTPPS